MCCIRVVSPLQVECPIEKIFAKTLRDKFPWAMSVPDSWRFTPASEAALELGDFDNDNAEGGGAAESDDE